MPDTLVLDTNAFNERGLLHFLAEWPGRKVLPAAAAAEYFLHLRVQRGWSVARFLALLKEAGLVVEPLDLPKALAAVEVAGMAFKDRPMDCLIGAHALAPGRILVTRNLADHPHVPRKQTPSELMRQRAS